MYRKRYWRHLQKKQATERSGKKVNSRTLQAVENNRKWLVHYETALAEIQD